MRIIKEFLEFREFSRIFQEIDIDAIDKKQINALGTNTKELLNKLLQKTKNHTSNKVVSEELSVEFIKGAKYTLNYIRGIIK